MGIPPIPPRRDGVEIERNQEEKEQAVQEGQDPQAAAEDLVNQVRVPVYVALAGVQNQLAILRARELEIPGELEARQRTDAGAVNELREEERQTREQIQALERIAGALEPREDEEQNG